mmetsp:Transcript_3856/g.7204  ORF Transcript_3856/g.7204 Transcript_3856/m.7204 type:complete len:415 (+) Transcript_3856:328-1572(+)
MNWAKAASFEHITVQSGGGEDVLRRQSVGRVGKDGWLFFSSYLCHFAQAKQVAVNTFADSSLERELGVFCSRLSQQLQLLVRCCTASNRANESRALFRGRSDHLRPSMFEARSGGALVCGHGLALVLVVSQLEDLLQHSIGRQLALLQVLSSVLPVLHELQVHALHQLGGALFAFRHRQLELVIQLKLERAEGGGSGRGRTVFDRFHLCKYIICVAKNGHTITPAVFEVDSGAALLVHDERKALVEPPIARPSVQHQPHLFRLVLRRYLVQREHEEGGVDRAEAGRVGRARLNQALSDISPLVAIECSQAPHRKGRAGRVSYLPYLLHCCTHISNGHDLAALAYGLHLEKVVLVLHRHVPRKAARVRDRAAHRRGAVTAHVDVGVRGEVVLLSAWHPCRRKEAGVLRHIQRVSL